MVTKINHSTNDTFTLRSKPCFNIFLNFIKNVSNCMLDGDSIFSDLTYLNSRPRS